MAFRLLVLFFWICTGVAYAHFDSKRCGLFISGHARTKFTNPIKEWIRERVNYFGELRKRDTDSFLSDYPINQLYERALLRVAREQKASTDNEEREGELLMEAVEAEIKELMQPGPHRHWTHGLREGLSIDAINTIQINYLSFPQFQILVEHTLKKGEGERLRTQYQPEKPIEEALPQQWAVELALESSWVNHSRQSEAKGRDVAAWLATDIELVLRGRKSPPERMGVSGSGKNITAKKLAEAGYTNAPGVTLIGKSFWLSIISQIEIHLRAMAGSAYLEHNKILEYDKPGFTVRDLYLEIYFQMLRWRYANRTFNGQVSAREIAARIARSFLLRFGWDDKGRKHKAGVTETESSETLFFDVSLDNEASQRLRGTARAQVEREIDREKFDVDDATTFVIDRLDMELALYWSRKRENPTEENCEKPIQTAVSRLLKQYSRQKADSTSRAEQRKQQRDLYRWRTMAAFIPTAIRSLSPRYQLSIEAFWQEYTESDVLEAVGTEAADWNEKKYSIESYHVEAREITRRAVRKLLTALAYKAKCELPENWRELLTERKIDPYAVLALLDAQQIVRALSLWSQDPSATRHIPVFRALYLEQVPAIVYEDRHKEELGARLVPTRHADFYRFMALYEIVDHCRSFLPTDQLEKRAASVFAIEGRFRELNLLYLARSPEVRKLSILPVLEALEAWATQQDDVDFDGERWKLTADRAIRTQIAARVQTMGETVSPAVLGSRDSKRKPIPSTLLVLPEGIRLSDKAWRHIALHINHHVDRETEKFSLTPEDFWAEVGTDAEKLIAEIKSEAAFWKREKLEGHEKLLAESEILRRAVRNICVALFHRRKMKIPEDAETRIAQHKLDREDVIAMIPPEEFSLVFAIWKLGFGISWRDKPKTRIQLFEDLFVTALPKTSLEKRYPDLKSHGILNRKGLYYKRFMELRVRYADPTQVVFFLLPPDPCPFDPLVWAHVQTKLTDSLNQKAKIDGELWTKVNARLSKGHLITIVVSAIGDFKGGHIETIRRRAPALAEKAATQVLSIVRDGAPLPPESPSLPKEEAKLPKQEDVTEESIPEWPKVVLVAEAPLPVVPVPTVSPSVAPTLEEEIEVVPVSRIVGPEPVREEEDDLDDDEEEDFPEDTTGTDLDDDDDEDDEEEIPDETEEEEKPVEPTPPPPTNDVVPIAEDQDTRTRVRENYRQALFQELRTVVADVTPRYGMTPLEFWKSEEGGYTEEELKAQIRIEFEYWVAQKFGDGLSASQVFSIQARAVGILSRNYCRKNDRGVPANWKELLDTGKTDGQALIDRVAEDKLKSTLKKWEKEVSERDNELLAIFKRAYITREDFERTTLSEQYTNEELDRLDELDRQAREAVHRFFELLD